MDGDNYSDAATFGSTSTLREENSSRKSSADDRRISMLLSDLNHLKKTNEELKIKERLLYGKIKSIARKSQYSLGSSGSDSLNDFLDSLGDGPVSVDEHYLNVQRYNSHGSGRATNIAKAKTSSQNKMDLCGGGLSRSGAAKSEVIDLEKLRLHAEIRNLTSQLSFQENTIKDDQEIIKVLRDTIKIMTEYIIELERKQRQECREDSFNIFSPSRAVPTVVTGMASSSGDSSQSTNDSNDIESKFCSVEAEIAVLLRALEKLKISHRRNGRSSLGIPKCGSEISLTMSSQLSTTSDYLASPYTYRETEFLCTNARSPVDTCQVVEHERLTAFSAVKVYQIVESSGVYMLYLQDNKTNVRSFFKFQNWCPMSIGGVTYHINVLFERTYDREWGDVMSLRVCFPGIWDCGVNHDPDLFIDRCLIVLTLLVDTGNTPSLRKYYVLHGIKSHDDPSHGHKSKTECARGSEEIFDACFCPFHVLKAAGQDNVLATRGAHEKLWENCAIEMKIFQLKYRNCSEESSICVNNILTQEEKYKYFKNSPHINCSKIVFRVEDGSDDVPKLASCDCIMMNCSPLFKEIFQANNYYLAPCEEIEVRNASKDTVVAILNYLHGVNNGSSWRRNVKLNLEVLGFAHEYFIPELAQLSTYNLLTTPDHYYTLDLVLNLQSLAKKLRNSNLENRALQWI